MKKVRVGASSIDGQGIIADETIRRGEDIQYIKGEPVRKVITSKEESDAIANWIGVGKSLWLNTDGTPFRYLNHSCRPNAAIRGMKTLVALEDIDPGAEITIDYSLTDNDPYYSITCTCGTANCRKVIRGIDSVPKEVFQRHMPFVPRYFQRVFFRNYIRSQKAPGPEQTT